MFRGKARLIAAQPFTDISTKARPRRITTPGTPPSRINRLERDADHRDRHVGRAAGEEVGQIVASAGRNITSAGPPTRNHVTLRERRVGGQPAAHRRQPLDQVVGIACGRRRHARPPLAVLFSSRRSGVQLAGQRVRPGGDVAGAEADDEVARLGQSGPSTGERLRRGQRQHLAMAVARAGRRPGRRGRRRRSAARRPARRRRRSRCRRR